MNDLVVIIVSFNCRDALRACLRSLPPRTRVVVVDNASADDTVEMLRAEFPAVTVIANDTNRGFAAACNQGIRATSEPFVLLLNPDTLHPPLEALLAFMRAHPDTGACGPRVLDANGKTQPTCRRFPTWWRMSLAELGIRRFYFIRNPDAEVDQLIGACLMVRRAALDAVGLFDEQFFLYFEEVDLCLRLHRAGWRVRYLPDATVTHLGGKCSASAPSESLRHRYESLFKFYRKHYPRWHVVPLRIAVALRRWR